MQHIQCRDHPRLRGNYGSSSANSNSEPGSPPLTRELQRRSARHDCRLGITPAYAGTTTIKDFMVRRRRDHPRLRGNYVCVRRSSKNLTGSPPLTRELPSLWAAVLSCSGITPAYAGTTPALPQSVLLAPGSPPLTRELPEAVRQHGRTAGITPAYAGTTIARVVIMRLSRDHPRLRGNYVE